MKRILTLLSCLALCTIPALAQKKSSDSALSDQQFVNFAAQTDMTEANLGQLAGTAAAAQPVKDYAQKLVAEQTTDFHQLSQVAEKDNLKVPTAIDGEHNKELIGPFQKLKGEVFDHQFVKDMIAEETKAIDVYKKEIGTGQNLDLRSYAQEALPALQTHLAAAKSMEKEKVKTTAAKG